MRGEQKATSDLDLLIEYQEQPTLADFFELPEQLSERLGLEIELVQNNLLKPYVGKHIRQQVIWLQKDGVLESAETSPQRQRHKLKIVSRRGAMEPKREYLDWIRDMVIDMENVQNYVQGVTYEQMLADKMRRDAIERATERIGEAANRIPSDIPKRYSDIPWTDIIGMRHQIAHGYDKIDYKIIWDTIHNSIPKDLPLVRAMLDAENKRRNIKE